MDDAVSHAAEPMETAVTPEAAPELAGAAAMPGVSEPARAERVEQEATLAALRALVLRAYPSAPPELVTGDTLAALVASAERAEQLARRLAAQTLPAGQPPRDPLPLPVEQLSPSAKIAHGLHLRR